MLLTQKELSCRYNSPSQILFVRSEYFTGLGNVPDLNGGQSKKRSEDEGAAASHLYIFVIHDEWGQELHRLPLEENL